MSQLREANGQDAAVEYWRSRALAAERQLAELCPVGDFDVITSLLAEKALMAEQISELERKGAETDGEKYRRDDA